MLRRKIGELFIKYRVRSSRGAVFTSEIDGLLNAFTRGGVIILIINQYFHIRTPLWILPAIWASQKVFEYGMGTLDFYYLKWWQEENNYVSSQTNPYLVKMMEHLIKIEEQTKK